MKPDAPAGIRSQFEPIDTRVPGIDICDQMPLLARHTDKIAIVRSLSHPSNNHEPSVYHMLTGRTNPTLVVPRNQRNRSDFPIFGVGRLALRRRRARCRPRSRSRGRSGTTASPTPAPTPASSAREHDPLEQAPANDSKRAGRPPHDAAAGPRPDPPRRPGTGCSGCSRSRTGSSSQARSAADLDEVREQAMRMMTSRRRSGGRSTWTASRRASATATAATSTARASCWPAGWSRPASRWCRSTWMYIMPERPASPTSGTTTAAPPQSRRHHRLRRCSRSTYCLPPLDRGLRRCSTTCRTAGCSTRRWWWPSGEFGRTPKINDKQGRDHWGACQSAAPGRRRHPRRAGVRLERQDRGVPEGQPGVARGLAGDDLPRPGLDPEAEVHDREGRPHRIVEGGKPVVGLWE